MMEVDLPEPVGAVLVKVKKKEMIVSFDAWEVLQYAVPGRLGLVLEVDMGSGQMGEVDAILNAAFAL